MALLATLALLAPTLTHGPMLGAADEHSLEFWARASEPGEYTFELMRSDHSYLAPVVCAAIPDSDLTLRWRIEGLEPAQIFGCRIRCGETVLAGIGYPVFHTQPAEGHAYASLAFGSGSDERTQPEPSVWSEIARLHSDAIVLLGDAPWSDSTELEVQRKRYRDFLAADPVRHALSFRSWYTTLGDHDYAPSALRAFGEYQANSKLGLDGAGICTSFRRGPVEVFLLDTRSSTAAKHSAWLQRGLAASKADFKVLACGAAWAERDAMLRWIGEQKISGVVLVGRGKQQSSTALAGYEVPELEISPSSFLWVQAQRYEGGSQFVGRIVDGAGKELYVKAFQLTELGAAPAASKPAPR